MCRNINIVPVLNGFVVGVGCQTIVCTSAEHLGKEITRYYSNSVAVEKEYRDKAVNKLIGSSQPECQQPECQQPCGAVAPPITPEMVQSAQNAQSETVPSNYRGIR